MTTTTRHEPPVTEASIARAKDEARAQREELYRRTGQVIGEDGRPVYPLAPRGGGACQTT